MQYVVESGWRAGRCAVAVVLAACAADAAIGAIYRPGPGDSSARTTSAVSTLHRREAPDDPPRARPAKAPLRVAAGKRTWTRGPYRSIQVNGDALSRNIPGDAANEPSIAVDPTDPTRIVIGWRQFDSVESNFRQAGWAYSDRGGYRWTFPGVLEDNVFRSDPVLDADADGNVYY